jgi:peptidoglycan/xylan/chitin deacetylase (PgdA/CDA1 family)
LDVLGEQNVRATFFLIGRQVARHPELVRRIVDEGHEIGHHTFHHRRPVQVSADELMDEIEQTDTLLEQITGDRSKLFRPPWGKLTTNKLLKLWGDRYSIILWNVDPKDCSHGGSEDIRAWLSARPLVSGDILLMHDDMPHAAAVLPQVIHEIRTRAMSFATVSDELN